MNDKHQWKPTFKEILLYFMLGILFLGQIVLCFLFFNWLNKIWLVYVGIVHFVIGFLIFGGMARAAFIKEGKNLDKKAWLDTKKLVDSGIFAVVRHPIYISFIFYVIGLMFISQHFLSMIFGIPIIITFYQFMRLEEKANIKKFGEKYKQYMQRVPRINFIIGIIRVMKK